MTIWAYQNNPKTETLCSPVALRYWAFYLSTVNQLQQVLIIPQTAFHSINSTHRNIERERERERCRDYGIWYIHHCYRTGDLRTTPRDPLRGIISRITPMFGSVIKFKCGVQKNKNKKAGNRRRNISWCAYQNSWINYWHNLHLIINNQRLNIFCTCIQQFPFWCILWCLHSHDMFSFRSLYQYLIKRQIQESSTS